MALARSHTSHLFKGAVLLERTDRLAFQTQCLAGIFLKVLVNLKESN